MDKIIPQYETREGRKMNAHIEVVKHDNYYFVEIVNNLRRFSLRSYESKVPACALAAEVANMIGSGWTYEEKAA